MSDRPPRKVVGTLAFRDPIDMAEKLFTAVGFRVDIEEVMHPDGRVLVFHIPSRPRGTAYHLEEEPARIGLTAEQVVELMDTQAFFTLMEKPYPTTQKAVLEQLLAERLIDRAPEGYSIRRMGAILLARRLTDFQDVSRKAARIVVYPSNSKLKTKLWIRRGKAAMPLGFVRSLRSSWDNFLKTKSWKKRFGGRSNCSPRLWSAKSSPTP